jgi:hypothetical protein
MFDYNRKLNPKQKVLTRAQFLKLVENHHLGMSGTAPVVKFFAAGSATWLLSELDPETGIAFGLCDLGMGFPELGSVTLDELIETGRVERDLHFNTSKRMPHWERHAAIHGNLVGV